MKILISDIYSVEAMARLRADPRFEIVQCRHSEVTPEILADVDVWLLRSRNKVALHQLESTKKLKLVVTATSGFDHLNIADLEARGVTASYTPDANVESAACHTLTLLLALTRHLQPAAQSLKAGEWRDNVPRGELLAGKTLGLFGLGRIGTRVAELGKAFGMTVMAFDPYQEDAVFERAGVERAGQAEVFRASDVLSLHVPLTRETFRQINHTTLHNLNPDALLINTSRGGVIEETELCEALDEGILRGVALDVFEREPLAKTSKLRGRKNVLLTPHLGAFTTQALEAASHQAVDRVFEWADGKTVSTTLPLAVPWYHLVGFDEGKGN